MIQVNRIYLIFNRLVTKKFLVDTSVANYLMEVCPLSRGVMSQPLSPPLQRGIRFLHRHLPTSRSVALAIDLPVPIMR